MPPELDNAMPGMEPEMGQETQAGEVVGLHNGEMDREGAMAKADLFKLSKYAQKLYKELGDEDQLEAWVQAKITKAADYLASVYHYLEYEMKFSEYGHHLDNSDTLSEGQKRILKDRLMEAKMKMKELKKTQADKVSEKKVAEGALSGGERPCAECNGSGMVYEEPKPIPSHVKGKVAKYNTMVKATKAAHKRIDANHNGIPDEDELEEEFDDDNRGGDQDTGSKFNVRKTSPTSTRYTRKTKSFSDEHDGGEGTKSNAKAKDADTKKAEKSNDIKLAKHDKPTWGKKGGENFGAKFKNVDEAKGSKPDFLDMDKDGNKKESMKKAVADKKAGPQKGVNPFAKKGSTVKEGTDEKKCPPMSHVKKMCQDGKSVSEICKMHPDCNHAELKQMVADCKKSMQESTKPSAGLSAAKKSSVVKKAKSGGDIGKPGKSFDKVAAGAGGGEKGKKIAAAAMWKNIKETTAYMAEKKAAVKDLPGNQEKIDVNHNGKIEKSDLAALRAKKETVKESTDMSRMRELTGRLNLNENVLVKKSNEVDQLKALTNLFKD